MNIIRAKSMKIVMIDPLVGNEYAACLAAGISKKAELYLVVTENRETDIKGNFKILKLSPAKNDSYNKAVKTFKYFLYFKSLLTFLIRNKIDVVHYQFFRRKSEILFFYFLKSLGFKIVFTAHNVLPHERKKLDYSLNKVIYRRADKIIVHTEYIKDKLVKNFPVSKDKVNIVPHGNFDNYLSKEEITTEGARAKLGLKATDKVLLFFGYIREYKGLDLLLDAFEQVNKLDSSIKLLIAGNPQSKELRSKYENKLKELKNTYAFLQFIPSQDVATYLTSADIVILPYRNIDHSGIIHLAYSFGKPVIATPVGDFPESVEDGRSGFVTDDISIESIKNTIIKAFSDMNKLEMMGNYTKYLNDTKYSWDSIAESTLNIYNSIVKRK
jgi:D-inositol-3-phosphate glycosyltransferase